MPWTAQFETTFFKSVLKAVRYESKLVCWILAVTFALLVSRADAFQATTIPRDASRQYRTSTRFIVGRHQMLKANVSFECLTIPELKDILRERGAKVSGNKHELIERLSVLQLHAEIDEVESDNVREDNNSSRQITKEQRTISASVDDLPFSIHGAGASLIPPVLEKLLQKRNITSLLPVQSESFELVYNGNDAVIHAPTGSGKTLAFAIPLLAKLLHETDRKKPVVPSPFVIVIVPSRELAKQVGRELHTLHPRKSKGVVTVFGGTPLERNVAALKGGRRGNGPDIVVGTAGRMRELVREGYLSFDRVHSIVLDEADTLLNIKDNPDVEQFINDMINDYQLILVSATINKFVRNFAMDIMEIDESSVSFVTINGRSRCEDAEDEGEKLVSTSQEIGKNISTMKSCITNEQKVHGAPPVRHWSIAVRSNVRRAVVSDLMTTLHPRITIIFVPSKAEVEKVASELADESGGDYEVRVLHGDMVQSARTRTITLLRGDGITRTSRQKVLVATDVASRGLDVDGVDLVVQFGIPRKNGKENTFDSELYTHRAGRAGRFGGLSEKSAHVITLYDPTQGEGKLLKPLAEELKANLEFDIWDKHLPSPKEIMDEYYERVLQRCSGNDEKLVQFFKKKISSGVLNGDKQSTAFAGEHSRELLETLSQAMAALSGLEFVAPQRSLLTADPSQRTVRIVKYSSDDCIIPTNPPEITKLCKEFIGKIGRVQIWNDGSAIFDLPEGKASKLIQVLSDLQNCHAAIDNWRIELLDTLPSK
eukprot:CAMPEP_0196818850 /NCGR_PEP_ID=MMETSP1362-20130617/67796_1 /TAXON_ID=163516 /ORGANISM="Leptocylindrus danicus, Strain CCMP1856" /LENGTH=767 /DNA_ID=CAMNT_0042197117 /DNA_START=54 /DNA_END=2358 /DNA_ORIENTATION=+